MNRTLSPSARLCGLFSTNPAPCHATVSPAFADTAFADTAFAAFAAAHYTATAYTATAYTATV